VLKGINQDGSNNYQPPPTTFNSLTKNADG
jgi:hypothetical protein